ncbi:hypothetical protein [Caproiciproducens sp. LBM24188]|nr:hypothetical protein [Oscillospiraceae bacterium]
MKKYAALIAATALLAMSLTGCRNTPAGSMVSSAIDYGKNVVSQAASEIQGTTSSFLVSSAVSGV